METQGKPKKQDNKKKWWSIWSHEHFQTRAELGLRISILLNSFFEGNMMHDNFYEYFVGAEKHEFQKFQVIDKLKSYAS